MTPADFDRLAARTRLIGASRGMAAAVLVDGLSATDAARVYRRKHQQASAAVRRIRAELAKESACPTCGRALPPDATPREREQATGLSATQTRVLWRMLGR